jgi:hypothetical protein
MMKLNFVTKVYASLTHLLRRLFPQHPNEGLTSGFNRFYYAPLVVVLLALVIHSINKPIGDFGNYYYGSAFLKDGQFGDWVYNPSLFNLKIFELGQRDFFLNYNPPPIVAVFYLPFTFFNIFWAKTVWNLLNCMLLVICLYRVQKFFLVQPIIIMLIPLLFFLPIKSNIIDGQSYFLLLFLLVEGFIQYQKGNSWLMAFLWSISILLKIFPVFVMLFLFFSKEYKGLIKLVVCVAGLVILSLSFVDYSVWYYYVKTILPKLLAGEINHTYSTNYQSLQVLLKTVFVPDKFQNQHAWFDNPYVYHKLLLAFKVVILSITVYSTFSKISKPAKFSFWLLANFLVSGHGNSFGLILLLIPLVFVLKDVAKPKRSDLLFIMCIVLILIMPFYWFSHLPLLLQFPRLYLLLLLFGSMLYLYQVKPNRVVVLVIAGSLFFPVSGKEYPQNYALEQDVSGLIYGFTLDKDTFIVNAFDRSGPYEKRIASVNKGIKKVTWIQFRKSCQINDSLVVYLSDEDRGFGFQTLRIK